MLNEFIDPAGQSNEVVDGTLATQEGGYGRGLHLHFFHRDGKKKPILLGIYDERLSDTLRICFSHSLTALANFLNKSNKILFRRKFLFCKAVYMGRTQVT